MRPEPAVIPRLPRLLALAGLALAITLGAALLVVGAAYEYLMPRWYFRLSRGLAPVAPLLAALWVLRRRPVSVLGLAMGPERWARLDALVARGLGRLPAVLLGASALLLAGWLPHYLRWPWWTDTDHFAVTALSWDRGILPYRDLLDFNFPGPAYVLWLCGKVFGWGRTWPYYLFDALLLLALGAALADWSRRRAGGLVPGLLGYIVFLAYYLALDISVVAQRDWQAPAFAVLGLLLLEARPGRGARLASAGLFVAALAFRPHAVLFLPAYASALDGSARRAGEPWRKALPALAEWSAAAGLGALLAFAPILLAGIGDDLVASFLASAWYGKSYDNAGGAYGRAELLREVLRWRTGGVLLLLTLLAARLGDARLRGPARTWALALAGVLLYKPLSPVVFAYHEHPLALTSAVGVTLLAASFGRAAPAARLCGLVLLGMLSAPGLPLHWSAERSARAIRGFVQGTPPQLAPLGCSRYMTNRGGSANISWEDYHAVLDHLRRHTNAGTRVGNYIRTFPCPPVNGPVGRLTAFPCAEGTQWLRWVAPELEGRFAESLVVPEDAVVVWDPEAQGFPGLERAIRRHYAPEATFGRLQVWRRRPAARPRDPAADLALAPTSRALEGRQAE